ncbi:scarecrow-like protein 21 [Cucumis melo var. makuwa]|uniref:Scarecrow-like protein 21 n=1 Tax=Cucumis melo var. makuwa TaxID=1194695 RepID=A0A5D3DQQ1_CUCMM|nr:scarecrow-like protein 21 [Cucumis melo var. makuwa]
MDSHQLFGFGVNSAAGLSFTSPCSSVPSLPNTLLGPLKFNLSSSPALSPLFSSHFEFDSFTTTTVSGSPDQRNSPDNLSGLSPSCNSSFETSSFNQIASSYLDHFEDESRQLHSGSNAFVYDGYSAENISYTLKQLESVLMGPDNEEVVSKPDVSFGVSGRPQMMGQRSYSWSQDRRGGSYGVQSQASPVSRSQQSEAVHLGKRQKSMDESLLQQQGGLPSDNLKDLLIACAKALSENRMKDFDNLVATARGAVSIGGEPIQRLGAYMVEGLVARKEESGANIYRALNCREPASDDLLSYMHMLYEICPYLKFGYMAANGVIAEACRNEDRIHIIDFQITQGTQWLTLLQALAARPSGAPHVRITGIDDPVSKYARGDGLEVVEKRLAEISMKYGIPVEFHGMPVFAPDITRDMLDIRPGEALAVNFPLQLHHTPDESVDVNNPRDGLLRMVKSLSPKVVTLVEQESNTNTTPFFNRFLETLDYYLAIFESIDVTLPRNSKKRINVEQHCLAKDIVNVIACEGRDREERHELFGKWKSRLTMAGFRQSPLSSYVNSVIRSLLKYYSDHYTLVEKDGAMLLGWKNRNLISASAWY